MPPITPFARLPLACTLEPAAIRRAIAEWMRDNHEKINHLIEAPREKVSAGWNQEKFCSSPDTHIVQFVVLIPGKAIAGRYNLVIYLHQLNPATPAEVCFTWEKQQGHPASKTSSASRINEIVAAFGQMPNQLWLPVAS